jgi:hypothetical protein
LRIRKQASSSVDSGPQKQAFLVTTSRTFMIGLLRKSCVLCKA